MNTPDGPRFSTCREIQRQQQRVYTFPKDEWCKARKSSTLSRAASNGLTERMVQSFKNHMKACKGSKLSIHQRIENFLLMYRSTKHPTTGRTPASLFLGRKLRTRLSLLRPNVGEKVMDSQAKQKATHDVHSKFREYYSGDRVLVKDLRKEDTWWPGSVAEGSGPRSYVVVLNDGRMWKRHVDHVRRDSMDRAVTKPSREMESQDKTPDIPLEIPFSVCYSLSAAINISFWTCTYFLIPFPVRDPFIDFTLSSARRFYSSKETLWLLKPRLVFFVFF